MFSSFQNKQTRFLLSGDTAGAPCVAPAVLHSPSMPHGQHPVTVQRNQQEPYSYIPGPHHTTNSIEPASGVWIIAERLIQSYF